MAERICSMEDCDDPAYARGWCKVHYKRWWKKGDPGPLPKRPCAVCGEPFTPSRNHPNRQKLCSRECFNRSRRVNPAELICPGCGTAFAPVGRQKFCSMRCGQRVQTRRRLGIADPERIGECWWCHGDFNRLDGRRLYCSAECARFVKSLWNLSRYGITRDDYRESWYGQGGKCAVCRQPERTARNHLLCIDHDHVTGRFRGLLCSHCNRGIGLFRDDPQVIMQAAEYVIRTRKPELVIA